MDALGSKRMRRLSAVVQDNVIKFFNLEVATWMGWEQGGVGPLRLVRLCPPGLAPGLQSKGALA